MTGDQHDIVVLLVKYALHEPLTEAEERALEQWRQRSDEHAALPEQFRDQQWLEAQRKQLHTPPTEEMWADIRQYINDSGKPAQVFFMPAKRRIGLAWYPVAALLLAGIIYGGMRLHQVGQLPAQVAQATMPTGFKALLTLANGQMIVLDTLADGAVLAEAQLRKADSNSYVYLGGGSRAVSRHRLVLATGAGVTRVQWPDGSSAWLRPGTSLDYATDFRSEEIRVEGEAWFRVAHDLGHPVTVTMADGSHVRVLGTSFDVRTGKGGTENHVALFSGKVRLVKGVDSVLLQPGWQAVTGEPKLQTGRIDSNAILAWIRPTVQTQDFDFKDADLLQMMPEIAAWYRVQVVNPQNLRGKGVRGEFLRTMPLPALIACLNEIEQPAVRIKLKEDTIFITPLESGH